MIVPFPPGGVADITARPVAEAMGRALKQPVVIENKAGAGGGVGMGLVARAKPDGYTVLLALSSISILPEADKSSAASPPSSCSWCRSRASPPIPRCRGARRCALEDRGRLRRRGEAGARRVHLWLLGQLRNDARADGDVRRRGGRQDAARALHRRRPGDRGVLGGQVDAVATGPSTVAGHVKGGKLRVLAHWGDKRLAALPDVPTLKEWASTRSSPNGRGCSCPRRRPTR